MHMTFCPVLHGQLLQTVFFSGLLRAWNCQQCGQLKMISEDTGHSILATLLTPLYILVFPNQVA